MYRSSGLWNPGHVWDGSYDQSTGVKGFRYFSKDKQGRQGGAVTFYVNVQLECMELFLGMHVELAESFWARLRGGHSANQEDWVEEAAWSSCILSATSISVGETPQQSTDNPGGSWNTLMVTSFSK